MFSIFRMNGLWSVCRVVRYRYKNGKRQATITTLRWSHDPYYIACHRKGHERKSDYREVSTTCYGHPSAARRNMLWFSQKMLGTTATRERVNLFAAKSQLSKEDFVNQLCKIWKDGMRESNIVNGFSSTGEGEQCLKYKILLCRVLWYM